MRGTTVFQYEVIEAKSFVPKASLRGNLDLIEVIAPDEWGLLCEIIPGVFGRVNFRVKEWNIGTKADSGDISRCRAVDVLSKIKK